MDDEYFYAADAYEGDIQVRAEIAAEAQAEQRIAKLEAQVKWLAAALRIVMRHLEFRSTGEQAGEFARMIENSYEVA